MNHSLTVRFPPDLAEWLERTARLKGDSRSRMVRMAIETARASGKQPQLVLSLAGVVEGPANLSSRGSFSPN